MSSSGNDISDWYASIPVISKYWFTGTVLLSILGKIGIVGAYYMVLLWEPFFYQFQIWRPITALFFYPITPQTGFHFLINLYFLYSYSTRLESEMFINSTADFLFMMMFNWFCLVILGFIVPIYLLMDPMVISVLYVWCQDNRDQIVQFWFGTQFKAIYLPWVLVAFNLIIQGGGMVDLLGIVIGHLYYFMAVKYPRDYRGRQLLKTPGFLTRMFQEGRHRGLDSNSASAGNWFSGRGQTLGGSSDAQRPHQE